MKTELYPSSHVIQTIELIKDCFPDASEICKNGSCVKFALLLEHIYGCGNVLYDMNHAIFEYGGNYYDIDGFAVCKSNHMKLLDYDIMTIYKCLK